VCSANDDPTTYTAPEPQRPRTYLLSGSVPPPRVAASVALATLGTLISEFEDAFYRSNRDPEIAIELNVLRHARDAVALAEAEYADGTVRG
jgi:hypothetical protein